MPSHTPFSWHEDARGVTLEGPYWTLHYDLPLGLFDLAAPAFPSFQVRWARARAVYRKGTRPLIVGSDDGRTEAWQVEPVEDGRGSGLRLHVRSNSGRRPALEFTATLYRDSPFLLLELTLHNTLSQPIAVEALQPLEVDPNWGGRISMGSPIAGLYRTGWQSWSTAGWKPAEAREPRSYNPFSGPMDDAPPLPVLRPGRLRADLAGVLTPAGEGPVLLCGLFSSADQFGALHARLKETRPGLTFACSVDGLPLAPAESLCSERVALLLASPEEPVLETYAEALGREMGARVGERAPSGWCSWTAFSRRIGEEEILRQLAWLAERRPSLPVDVVQVDDGWEQAVGDWEPNERFPHGMAWLAEEIRRAGFVPGLWLAPFIARPRSGLATSHPEWLLRDERGRPVPVGVGSVNLCHGLDLTRPEAQEWLHQLIATVTEQWGYRYLKLDFLYAAALAGRRHRPDYTRAQALRRGLEIVRQAAGGEVFLLGCGCPLGPAIGLVDGMRIGPDVDPNWQPALGPLTPLVRIDPLFPAAARAVHNTLARSWTHRRLWLNDPDALILRRAGSRLSEAEVRTLATVVALSGGLWMLGDDLPALEAGREPTAAVGLPIHAGRPHVPDLLARDRAHQVVLEVDRPWGHGWVVALINWQDRPAGLAFDLTTLGLAADRPCHLHEFWSGEYRRAQGSVRFAGVEPHGCRVFLLRPVEARPQWVGSTLHVVQGQEVQAWRRDRGGLRLTLDAGRSLKGSLVLWLPGIDHPRISNLPAGVEASIEPVEQGLWRVRVRTDGAGPWRMAVHP